MNTDFDLAYRINDERNRLAAIRALLANTVADCVSKIDALDVEIVTLEVDLNQQVDPDVAAITKMVDDQNFKLANVNFNVVKASGASVVKVRKIEEIESIFSSLRAELEGPNLSNESSAALLKVANSLDAVDAQGKIVYSLIPSTGTIAPIAIDSKFYPNIEAIKKAISDQNIKLDDINSSLSKVSDASAIQIQKINDLKSSFAKLSAELKKQPALSEEASADLLAAEGRIDDLISTE